MLIDQKTSGIRLIDLGLSKKQRDLMTTIVGTPMYIAPEIFTRKYGSKCDLWSVGVMTYFILTGAIPFSGKGHAEIMKQAANNEISFDHHISPDA